MNKLETLITENIITETELKEHLIANSKDYDLETLRTRGRWETPYSFEHNHSLLFSK